VTRKGKHFQKDGQTPSGPGHDFFGHGDEIRAALSARLPKQPVRALDVGTGFGRNAVFLARLLAPGSHVWSVDPSEESLKLGAAAVQDAGLAAAVTLGPGSAERLPFRDEEFDLTVGVMLFHHLVEVPPRCGRWARHQTRRQAPDRGLGADRPSASVCHRAPGGGLLHATGCRKDVSGDRLRRHGRAASHVVRCRGCEGVTVRLAARRGAVVSRVQSR